MCGGAPMRLLFRWNAIFALIFLFLLISGGGVGDVDGTLRFHSRNKEFVFLLLLGWGLLLLFFFSLRIEKNETIGCW